MKIILLIFCVLLPISALGSQKLITNFELADLQSKVGTLYEPACLTPTANGFTFGMPFSSCSSPAWLWNMAGLQKSEGTYALAGKAEYVGYGSTPSYKRTPYWSFYYPSLSDWKNEARVVLNTHGWLQNNPALRDWSGYTKLWLDVYAVILSGSVKVQVAIEDEVITPPIMRKFQVPAGRWVTLEVDMDRAVRERSLNTSAISGFWILAFSNCSLYVDNIRLAQTGDSPVLTTVLTDDSTMVLGSRQPAVPVIPIPALVPNRTRFDTIQVMTVDTGSLVPCGFAGAFDNDRLFVAFNRFKGMSPTPYSIRFHQPVLFKQTADGGATWSAIDSTRSPDNGVGKWNMDHASGRGNIIDMWGNGAWVSNTQGCAGFLPNPRQHVHQYDLIDGGWVLRPTVAMMDGDTRHCGHSSNHIIRQRFGNKAGRLWSSWGVHGRMHAAEVGVAYSDDNGETWSTPKQGYGPIPGSRSMDYNIDSYVMPETDITQYGEYAAVVWQDERGLLWSFFSGTEWSTPRVIHTGVRIGENKPTVSAVTMGTTEIYVTSANMSGVMRWDGSVWHQELAGASGGGVLSVCGDGVNPGNDRLLYFTAGDGRSAAPVNGYRRKAGGTWEDAITLSGGPVTIDLYNTWTGLTAQPYSPPNFAAIAWSTGGVIRMAKVPPADYVLPTPVTGSFLRSPAQRLVLQPNPFNAAVTINASLSGREKAEIRIFTSDGKVICSHILTAAHPSFVWDAGGRANGLYLVRMVSGGAVWTRPLMRVN